MFGVKKAEAPEALGIPFFGMSFEEKLLWLTQYGKPRVGMYGDRGNWHASCELRVLTPGGEFNVHSEYTHRSPGEALDLCIERVQQALIARGN